MMNYTVFETSLGWMGLTGSQSGISRVILPKQSRDDVLTILKPTNERHDKNVFENLTQRLIRYCAGETVTFPDKLDLSHATDFQKSVWQAAQTIPYGQTRSYGWIAAQTGKPNAARAVGQALGRNPIPILIPCHRVIACNCKLGGFSGGIDMKKNLLDIEKRQCANTPLKLRHLHPTITNQRQQLVP
ncbi:methylated-DNA--[protein]-cysteine S-methyltransferase [Chloroflexota bacterium]